MTTSKDLQNVMPNMKNALSSSFSFVKQKITALFRSIARKQKKSSQSNLYRRVEDTPLKIFVDCLVHHNYRKLIISGNPTEEEIKKAWDELFLDYCDLSGSDELRRMVELTKKIGALQAKLIAVKTSLLVLSTGKNSEQCKTVLNKLGFNYESKKDIAAVISASKSFELELKKLTKEYQSGTSTGKAAISEHYFKTILVELSKYMGFRLTMKDTTVEEFLLIKNSYEREARQAQKYKEKWQAKER